MRAHKRPADAGFGRTSHQSSGPPLGVVTALLVAAAVGAAAILPPALVLPALSTGLVLTGLVLAAGLVLRRTRLDSGRPNAWDLAGALVFFGFAAGLLADSEQALIALEQMQHRG
jgi:hypothetical protein